MEFNIENYRLIEGFIKKNTKNTVKIIAISKNHPVEKIIDAANKGITIFGENRVQEAKIKFEVVKKNFPNIELHLTGPLQTNKTKEALKIFDVFHTLDREKLANEFNKLKAQELNKKFFIQINTGKESSKSGILPELADKFISYCKDELNLNIIGLMCIPPIADNPKEHFLYLKEIANKNKIQGLSMGMSSDFRDAISVGATHIRVGTFLFGGRNG